MATSTFSKQFAVRRDKADAFTAEMSRKVPPTLTKDFESQMVHARDLSEKLKKALTK